MPRKKSAVDSADTLGVKKFVEIVLSHTVSEINAFYAKNKQFFSKKWQMTLHKPTVRVRNFAEIALSCTVSETLKVFHFQQKNHGVYQSLIGQPFCNGSLPKVNDFQTSISQTYLPNFMRICKALFKLSSGQAHPFQKHGFGHVTSLIG